MKHGLGHLVDLLGFGNLTSVVLQDLTELVSVWNLKSLAHEGVTQLLDLLTESANARKHDEVGAPGFAFILELLEMSQSHTLGDSEEHALHALLLPLLNGSGDVLEHLAVLSHVVLHIGTDDIGWNGTMELGKHLLHEGNNLLVVLELGNSVLHLLDGLDLLSDEDLVLANFLLDGVKEQIVSLLLVTLNSADVAAKDFGAPGLVDDDSVLFALVDQEENAAFSFIAPSDLIRVGQTERLLSLVQIEEVSKIDLTQRLNDLPNVVLWNG